MFAQGISRRLHSGPTSETIGRQGKRVARLFSLVSMPTTAPSEASPAAPTTPEPASPTAHDSGEDDVPGSAADADELGGVLFDDEELGLLPEEIWWQQAAPQLTQDRLRAHAAERGEAESGPVTDSEDSDASSGSLAALDTEEVVPPIDVDKKWRPVQLHNVLADVRQSKDTVLRVAALQKIEQLVRCAESALGPAYELCAVWAGPEELNPTVLSFTLSVSPSTGSVTAQLMSALVVCL